MSESDSLSEHITSIDIESLDKKKSSLITLKEISECFINYILKNIEFNDYRWSFYYKQYYKNRFFYI